MGAFLTLVLPHARASATWSIVAVDPETQEVGVAVASCVEAPFGTTLLPQVTALAPGIGALAAQAQLSQTTRDLALDLLRSGASPQEVIDMVVATDGGASVRQYGVVDLNLEVAGFTGDATMPWAGHVAGLGVAAQGNILHGPEVVDETLAAFLADGPSCPWTLADRLMLALEAGSAQGGDTRCSKEQSALAATLMVARKGDAVDAPAIDLRIPSQPEGGDNPVMLLRASYDAWRATNPPDDAGCGATGTTGSGTSSGSAPADDTHGETSVGEPHHTTGSPTDRGTGVAPDSGGSSDTDGTGAPASFEGDRGCGCRASAVAGTTDDRGAHAWLLAVLIGVRLRPRPRPKK